MKKEKQTSCKKNRKSFVPREPELQADFTETAFGLNMEMVYVEGGEFKMGATEEQGDDVKDDEKSVRNIKLDGFHIGRCAVTQAQWKAVMGTSVRDQLCKTDPERRRTAINPERKPYGEGDTYPMYYVSWVEAREFCRRLSDMTGQKYMLPTEAQWEYAARGGNKSRHYKYAGGNDLDEVAWYSENSINLGSDHSCFGTNPVGIKKANELGIYDMSGNVREWCLDWYGSYDENDTVNPQGPVEDSSCVMRGGGWYSDARYCRVSNRFALCPDVRGSNTGFRVVCSSKEVEKSFVPREPELREDFMEMALGLNMEMVYVEGGAFGMGATVEQENEDADDNEKPVRTVQLDGYHIGKYEVTQAQWKAVMGTSLREHIDMFKRKRKMSLGELERKPYGEGDEYPMHYVSWEDAQAFCQKLSEVTGMKYILPTEAQWEYAARGGNKSKRYKYAGSNDIDEVAWYWFNSRVCGPERPGFGTHQVGTKKANELGIYDMTGNVGEWCSDRYAKYDKNDTENPQGPAVGARRVIRGGGWKSCIWMSRVSFRGGISPKCRCNDCGFRVVCCLK